jgi:hypothetical protein
MNWWAAGLLAVLATACARAPGPALQISWHLIRAPEGIPSRGAAPSRQGPPAPCPAASSSSRPSGAADRDAPSHCLYLTVINSGAEPLPVPALTIVGGDVARTWPAPAKPLPPGGVRVIDLGVFDCWFPVKVVLPGGEAIPVPLLPSGFPQGLDKLCPWPDAKPRQNAREESR